MNRPLSRPVLPQLFLYLVSLLCAGFSLPAQAMNDWYKIGYSEGYLKQERVCQQQMQQHVQAQFSQLNDENQRLRQELARLQQMVAGQGGKSAADPAVTSSKTGKADAVGRVSTFRDDTRPRYLAFGRDDGDGG